MEPVYQEIFGKTLEYVAIEGFCLQNRIRL